MSRGVSFQATARRPCGRVRAPVLAAVLAVAASCGSPLLAQPPQDRTVPRDIYFLAFGPYDSGEYKSALRAFNDAAAGGIRSTEGRWIDSICYHTMIGECYYQMGDLPRAIEQYDAALKLFLVHRNWLLNVQFPDTIGEASADPRANVTWGKTKRATRLGAVPDRIVTQQGSANTEAVLRTGGVISPPQLFPVRVTEIVRATALAMRRRRELAGPVSAEDPLSAQLVEALAARPGPVRHWSAPYIDVQLGMAYAAAGKNTQAVDTLQKSLVIAGQYDHPLTSMALLELGKLAFEANQYEAAATFFLEATFTATAFGQADVMEEAFRHGQMVHLVTNQPGLYGPLLPATAWAQSRKLNQLHASLLLLTSENLAVLGDTSRAAALLDEAGRVTARRDMRAGVLGARTDFQAALVNFQAGKVDAGTASLASAMNFQRSGSRRLFQIELVDKLFLAGSFTPRVADDLFSNVLREPTARDWAVEPMETLTCVMTPHPLPMDHWFNLALERKEPERALEISDRIRRRKFYSSLPMGGRLVALRWVLEAPEEALTPAARLQRNDLLAKYPAYAELSRQSAALRAGLAGKPLAADTSESGRAQAETLAQLARTSTAQEVVLRHIALRREPSEFAFPPLRPAKDIQASLGEGQLMLAFHFSGPNLHAFLLSKDRYANWAIESPVKVRAQVANLMKALGHVDKNAQLTSNQIRDERWRQTGAELLQVLLRNSRPDHWEGYDELVIVPDGYLWYVPFECLPVSTDAGAPPLLSRLKVRYAPTSGLGTPDARPRRRATTTSVAMGKLFPRDDAGMADEALTQLRRVLPGTVALPAPLPGPSSMVASVCERLIVLDDLADTDMVAPFDWAPIPHDRGKPGSTLANWMALPRSGADELILPGFHSGAEDGLKRRAGGDEIFLSACGLMSGGPRTILLSRWRVAGQSTYDLVREFAQELPHTTAADAWQRSVELLRRSELDLTREPRIRGSATEESAPADHPFVWGAYLLIDTGATPGGKEVAAR